MSINSRERDRPDALDLVAATRASLRELVATANGRDRQTLKMAIRALGIVERELQCNEAETDLMHQSIFAVGASGEATDSTRDTGDVASARQRRLRIAATADPAAPNAATSSRYLGFVERLRNGDLDRYQAGLHDALMTLTRRKLALSNPRYLMSHEADDS